MGNTIPTRIWFIAACLLIWGIGGPVLLNAQLIPSQLLTKELASLVEISIWTILCAGATFAGWKFFNNTSEEPKPLLPVANVVTFKINKSFSQWSKEFDKDLEIQEEAGLKPLFRAVSREDNSKVMAIFIAVPGAIDGYLKEKQEKVSNAGLVLGTEEIAEYSID